MSDSINDGGPAFPCNFNMSTFEHEIKGMTLRDWFAGQALVGVSSVPAFHTIIIEAQIKRPGREKATVGECVAYYCYDLADAMLKARNKEVAP